MRKSNLKKQSGFSLIELMVVVVIIGLLATLAIPQYGQFQRRAIQTEAKGKLGALFMAENTFLNEWGYGTTNFELLGYEQKGSDSYYVVGWHASDNLERGTTINATTKPAGYRGPAPSILTSVNSIAFLTSHPMAYSSPSTTVLQSNMERVGVCVNTGGTGCCASNATYPTCTAVSPLPGTCTACTATAGGVNNTNLRQVEFTIGATGVIDGSVGVGNLDQWTINEDKVLENTASGL